MLKKWRIKEWLRVAGKADYMEEEEGISQGKDKMDDIT